MNRLGRYILLLLVALGAVGVAWSQESSLHLVGRAAHNTTFGGYVATSLTFEHTTSGPWAVMAGGQYSSFGKAVAEVRPSWSYDTKVGILSVEALGHCAAQGRGKNMALGLGVGLRGGSAWAQVGYYARHISLGGSSIAEPFNLYYNLGVELLRGVEEWELSLALTNSLPYELERHYQPSLVVAAKWHLNTLWALTFDATYKPTGMFHISSGYYQSYVNLGICYKW